MKKNKGAFGITLAMCMALAVGSTGCGTDSISGKQEELGVLEKEDTDANSTSSETLSNEDASNADTEQENTITGEFESTAEQSDEAELTETISGNGGHFVGYEGKVYFRIPSKEAMKEPALWGEYDEATAGKGCTIAAFDPETLEMTELFEDTSYGPMVISGDRLVMSESVGENEQVVQSVSFDGTGRKDLPGTTVYGTQPSGEYFITGGYEEDNKLHMYVCDSNGGSTKIENSQRIYYYAGITEDFLFCVGYSDENICGTLMGYDLKTGKEVIYGDIPTISEYQSYPGVPEYLYEENGYAYLQLSDYEGSGNFYVDSKWVKVKCDTEGTLEEVTPKGKAKEEYEDLDCPAVILKDGELVFAEGVPNTAGIDYSGDAGFYDDNGHFISVAGYYGTTIFDNYVDRTNTEFCELVGRYIYVVKNEETEAPDDNVGWRDAYYRTETNIKRINTKNGDDYTIICVKNPDIEAEDSADSEEPLKGLVADDILTKFRSSNPAQAGASVYEEAYALGSWVQDTIGKNNFPKDIRDMGQDIGNAYEFCFGTDVANNFDNNIPAIYGNYYALKDYYNSDGKRSVKRYEDLMGDNEFLGDGRPETLEQMYLDLQEFITACNNLIREK